MCRRPRRVLSRFPAAALAGVIALQVWTPASAERNPVVASQRVQAPGTPARALARLFTPLQAPEGTYAVTVLAAGIDQALREVRSALAPGATPGQPPGSWQVQQIEPLEAFGTAGRYDRSKVARLYAGRRVSVVRGPVERDGSVVAAVTLFSPYPDATLSRLEAGTLVVLIRVAGSR